MLKKIRLLFLGLIVLAGSACVSPTHASSASSVIMTYVQAAGVSGAKEELIVLYNNSPVAVDITNWCLVNKSAVAFACFTSDMTAGYSTQFILPAYQSAAVGSHQYRAAQSEAESTVALAYEITHQSSGSIVNSGDTITLVDADGEVIDTHTWDSAPAEGVAWVRIKVLSGPDVYAASGNIADWTKADWMTVPESGLVALETQINEDATGGVEEDIPSQTAAPIDKVIINEVFSNAKGADAGKEFIELYNTSTTEEVLLDGLQFRIGSKNPKWYPLPSGVLLPAGGYITFSDEVLGFTLGNSHEKVQLYYADVPVGEVVEYTAAKDGTSWSLIGGVWQYTNQLTPAASNIRSIATATSARKSSSASTKKPCAANQFRNPATGRCKLIAADRKAPSPCKTGYERNPATNRCRKIAIAKVPKPCKEGQERNAETNRCRTIKKMTTAGHGVKGVQTTAAAQLHWYYWGAIGGVIALVLGYAVWEWRQELLGIWRRFTNMFAKK